MIVVSRRTLNPWPGQRSVKKSSSNYNVVNSIAASDELRLDLPSKINNFQLRIHIPSFGHRFFAETTSRKQNISFNIKYRGERFDNTTSKGSRLNRGRCNISTKA